MVYSFYICEIFKHQFITPDLEQNDGASLILQNLEYFDSFVPVASIIKFLIYMGWFKVGLSLINPLREDQSNFPMEEILEFNLKISKKMALCPETMMLASLQADEVVFSTALKQEQEEAEVVVQEAVETENEAACERHTNPIAASIRRRFVTSLRVASSRPTSQANESELFLTNMTNNEKNMNVEV
ncbi:unnamed protein product [Protopolystoma xenopodis]|uniref:Bestrophin homolog n=1 Tax=Protopolystoma xenopodis TaxID=117903 RepID=A0A448XH39_9PLAT|nr:unnamed protein product [Protopolystoma xenopodis]